MSTSHRAHDAPAGLGIEILRAIFTRYYVGSRPIFSSPNLTATRVALPWDLVHKASSKHDPSEISTLYT